jgi:hypothetical protein
MIFSLRRYFFCLPDGLPDVCSRLCAKVVPVYDYALVTEPLSGTQLASLGWKDRRGASDLGNQFHYFRLTRDNRILWGGYDAVYYNGGRMHDEQASRPETFARLAAHFFATFPQLEGVCFTHARGGVIDTCTRFCAFFGTAYRGRLAYTAGYTGLGGWRYQVRRAGHAGHAGEIRYRTQAAGSGPLKAGPVSAGTVAFGGRPADPILACPRRPQRRPP